MQSAVRPKPGPVPLLPFPAQPVAQADVPPARPLASTLAPMKPVPAPPLFEFESGDSLARFSVWMVPVAGGGAASAIAWNLGGIRVLAAMAVVCILLVLGLRSSISVRSEQVTVTRKWFFIPYKTYRAPSIEDVSYGGDYGLEEGAVGVVVRMGGKEVHLGTAKNMRFLYEALSQVAYSGVAHVG